MSPLKCPYNNIYKPTSTSALLAFSEHVGASLFNARRCHRPPFYENTYHRRQSTNQQRNLEKTEIDLFSKRVKVLASGKQELGQKIRCSKDLILFETC